MSETPPAPSSGVSTPPSSAAEQARIRKERREAKIKAGGSARLNKITGLGGSIPRDPPPQQPTVQASDPTADPEEVDISQHFYTPERNIRPRTQPSFPSQSASANQQISDEQLRAMMLGNAMPQSGPQPPMGNPFAGFPGMEGMGGMPGIEGMGGPDMQDDPMMKMLQQMMGGMGGPPGEGMNGMPSFPGMPPMGMPGQPGVATTDPYAYLWRIVHAIFALALGLYVAFTTTFSGTKLDRDLSGIPSAQGISSNLRFFYIFATVEVMLQSSRFFLEKGRTQQTGILGMVMGFLPEPYRGYLAMVLRYGRIWTTVSADAMVCLFVLGITCWWRGNI